MSHITKSQAKKMMISFIKETKENPNFSFRLHGNEEDARKFVHRMRVELSRMRETVKDMGRVPREFKMNVQEFDHDPMTGITTIKLQRVEGKNVQIAEDVHEIFEDIAGAERIQ